jgi:3-polyprenyl-4-hydroxybenzoate decarboxylase
MQIAPEPPSAQIDPRRYRDLREHLQELDRRGLLQRISIPINKDTELHPLVRWQYRGGISEQERKAFLFERVVDSNGREYDHRVVVGALAASPAIYAVGLSCPEEDVPKLWARALANPIEPILVETGPAQEMVERGPALLGEGAGMGAIRKLSRPGEGF